MVGCADKHTRYTYKLYNLETKRVVIIKDIDWVKWKTTDAEETTKIFCDSN